MCLACVFKREDKAFEFGKMVYQGVGWDLIVLLAATMPLCAAMESADTGIVATVLGILGPLVAGLSPFAYLAAVLILFGLTTQVVAQYGPSSSRSCPRWQLGHELRHPSALFALIFAMMMQTAFMTPAASAQAVMVFGNTEWITNKQAYLYARSFSSWCWSCCWQWSIRWAPCFSKIIGQL